MHGKEILYVDKEENSIILKDQLNNIIVLEFLETKELLDGFWVLEQEDSTNTIVKSISFTNQSNSTPIIDCQFHYKEVKYSNDSGKTIVNARFYSSYPITEDFSYNIYY